MSAQDAITYTGLTQAVIAYLSLFGWTDLMESVYSGEVGSDLLKPMGYFRFWLARDLGRAAVNLLFRGLGIMTVYALIFDITVPTSVTQWMALLAALILAHFVSFSWRFLVNLAAFWTPDARGIARFAFGLTWVMSGFFMPLRFYPTWFQTLCNLTPFPSTVNTPVEIYLGLLTGLDLFYALLTQLFWWLALVLLAQVVLRRGVKHLVIQGG